MEGGGGGEAMLVLDPQIRDWVVLPMVLIMVLMGLTRHYVTQLLESDKPLDVAEVRRKQTVMRANRLRMNGGYLSPEAFNMRKTHFLNKESGLLQEKVPKTNMAMMDPSNMVDMMKKNVTFLVPNMVMMTIISTFFSGFVLVKVPFPLTNRFKTMLQRGVDLTTLDVSYVSSLSWYFLIMFGLRGLYKLILGEDSPALDEAKAAQAQMGMGMAGGMGFNAEAAYKTERDQLDLLNHKDALAEAEKNLLGPNFKASKKRSDGEGGGGGRRADGAQKRTLEREVKDERKEQKRRQQRGTKAKVMR